MLGSISEMLYTEWKDKIKTYADLAKEVGDMVLCNNIASRIGMGLELDHGCDYDEEDDYYYDIYQWYIISESGAEFLEMWTDEIVYYDYELDIYVWGIDHWGTSWDGVPCEIVNHYDEFYEKVFSA